MTEPAVKYPSFVHRILPALQRIGIDHEKIAKSTALIVGAGGLGSRIVTYLARYPLREIRVIDNGNVEWENVGYQNYPGDVVGKPKAVAAEEVSRRLYPWANVRGVVGEAPDLGWNIVLGNIGIKYDLEKRLGFIEDLVKSSDLVIVATDTLGSRVAVWLTAMALNKPFIDTGFRENYGHIFIWLPGFMCPLDYRDVGRESFTRSEPGYPVEPFTADLIALVTSKLALHVLNGDIKEAVLVEVKADIKSMESRELIQIYPWTAGICRHYDNAQKSVAQAIRNLVDSKGQ
ncbi:MAG: ThiF family adenylyltransferase [Thermoproteus sp.]